MLEDRYIKGLVKEEVVINATPECIQPISVDLNIESVVYWKIKEQVINNPNNQGQELQDDDVFIAYQTPYQLKPHETVFVKTKEGLKMPDNLVGRIIEKNSVMRLGLQVSGPLYQPTHQTAIFLRVTNLTEYIIELHKGFSIAQITFEYVQPPETPYAEKEKAGFQGEFTFRPPHTLIKKAIKLEDQIKEQIKDVESKTLTIFTIFMGAFVSSLALIVVNFNIFSEMTSVKDIVIIDGALAVCIAVILRSVFYYCFKLTRENKKGLGSRMCKRVSIYHEKIKFIWHRKSFMAGRRKSTKIYLAACYCEHERNQRLYDLLTEAGFDVFLPEHLQLEESSDKQVQSKIFYSCYYKLSKCGIVLAVYPFGKSVSAEIGYAIAKNKTLIELKPKNTAVCPECMIDSGFHFMVESEDELKQLLKKLLTN